MKCLVLTPERAIFEGAAASAQIPAHDGLRGIFPGHAPMIGRLGDGLLTVKSDRDGQEIRFVVFGGYCRIGPADLTLLTEEAMPVSEVDPESGSRRLEAARKMSGSNEGAHRARQRETERARILGRAGRAK
jgi:F-type H+-transporting ATPase subunit epsilon